MRVNNSSKSLNAGDEVADALNVDVAELKDLTADDILSADDRVIRPVPVPEWGGKVWVRSMSAGEKERYVESVRKTIGKGRNATEKIVLEESSAKLAQQTICNKEGVLLFSPAQIKQLAKKSAKAMQRVVDVASELNGLSDDAEEQAKNDSPRNDDSSTE